MVKIGRNDPCPCGSGKKYKKCCLEMDKAAARSVREADNAESARATTRPVYEQSMLHFHCGECGATYLMEHAQDVCAKCGANFEVGGVGYGDEEPEGPHVHCGKCNELVALPRYCVECGKAHGDLPEICPECGASLDDALPGPPSLYQPGRPGYGHRDENDQDEWDDWDDDDDVDDVAWQCGICLFDNLDGTLKNCPNCGVSYDEVPMFDGLEEYREPPEFDTEDWLWCSQCFRLFQGKDMLPGEPPVSEHCPFADCCGEDYGFDIFKYYPTDGAPVAVKGMKHPKALSLGAR